MTHKVEKGGIEMTAGRTDKRQVAGPGLGVTLAAVALLALGLLVVSRETSIVQAQAGTGIIRVATTGSDTPACGNSIIPCLTVQYALDQALPGEELRVAAGIYTDTVVRAPPPGYPNLPVSGVITQVLYISKTVTVRGGYTTTNNFADPPDPVANPTTLEAEGQGRVVFITGEISPTVTGLRLTGGDATGLGGDGLGDAGGGVYVDAATATISDCVVYGNTASTSDRAHGGGLYLLSSAATLISNTMQGNVASTVDQGWGGGLHLGYSAAKLIDNRVQGNAASSGSAGCGGGLSLHASDATLSGNTVLGNTATSADSPGYGGGLYLVSSVAIVISNTMQGNMASTGGRGWGGGVYLDSSAATLSSNTVYSNTASTADRGYGGGLFLWSSSGATLINNAVRSNTATTAQAGSGGGLYLHASDATLSNNTVQGNTASTVSTGDAGGLYVWQSAVTLSGNSIISNTATQSPISNGYGGGLRVRQSTPFTLTNNLVADNQANTEGSGLSIDGSSTYPALGRLLHTTIADNRSSGQGVFVGQYSSVALTNTIIAGHHSVGITVWAGSTATLEATLWDNNGSHTGGAGTILSGTVNVYDAPAFANPAAWDYHLTSRSAALNAGVDAGVADDIDGDPRPISTGYDIGADEWGPRVYLPIVVKE